MGPTQRFEPTEKTRRIGLVAFVDKPERSWWDRVFRTRPGFRHTFILLHEPWAGCWLLYEWVTVGSQLWVVESEDLSTVAAYIDAMNGTLLRYEIPPADKIVGAWNPPTGYYCVPAIRHLLRLKGWIYTPYQLYCRLIKAGATHLDIGTDHGQIIRNPETER